MLHGSKGADPFRHWRVVAVIIVVVAVCYCIHSRCDLVRSLVGKGSPAMMTCLHEDALSRMHNWCHASEHSIPIHDIHRAQKTSGQPLANQEGVHN